LFGATFFSYFLAVDVVLCWASCLIFQGAHINPLNAELNPVCHLLALLGARHILHISGLRVKDEIYALLRNTRNCSPSVTASHSQQHRCENLTSHTLYIYIFFFLNLVFQSDCSRNKVPYQVVLSSTVGATARCGLWPIEQYFSIFPYLSPTLPIFSSPALEDLFILLLLHPFLGLPLPLVPSGS